MAYLPPNFQAQATICLQHACVLPPRIEPSNSTSSTSGSAQARKKSYCFGVGANGSVTRRTRKPCSSISRFSGGTLAGHELLARHLVHVVSMPFHCGHDPLLDRGQLRWRVAAGVLGLVDVAPGGLHVFGVDRVALLLVGQIARVGVLDRPVRL